MHFEASTSQYIWKVCSHWSKRILPDLETTKSLINFKKKYTEQETF